MTSSDFSIVYVWNVGQFDDIAYVSRHKAAAPDIINHLYHRSMDKIPVDLQLEGMACTTESKDAFIEALRHWLQTQYDAGDRTYDGLSTFVEQARIEYLQLKKDDG